jgi:pimeloyl-ACP methyl ester carboxylesterase
MAEPASRADDADVSWPDSGLVSLGIGVAATGVGTLLGLAAERFAVARRIRPEPAPQDDGRGGVPLGSVRGEARVVISGGVPLHVEIDEPDDDRAEELSAKDLASIPTVVFSHGYALTLDFWHYQRLALRGRYRLVLWDQRGHGRSGTGPAGSSTIDQVGADLAAVIDEVAPTGPLVLVGHSMGGMTVMSLAALRPDLFSERVYGVALLSTSAGGEAGVDLGFAGLSRLAVRAAPAAARVLARQAGLVAKGRRLGSDLESVLVRRYSFASPVPWQLVTFAAQMIARTRMEVISDFLPTFGTHDKRMALAAMHQHDVLVLAGDSDVLIPAAASEQIAALIPHAQQVVIADAGHLVPLEHPALVTEPIEELLRQAQSAARAHGRPGRRRGWGRRTVTPIRQRWPRRKGRRSGKGGRT